MGALHANSLQKIVKITGNSDENNPVGKHRMISRILTMTSEGLSKVNIML